MVGDDDQSIYGWRGAQIANLLDMERHFPKVKVIRLEQNYRSPTTILSAANAVIQHNLRRRPKQLWSQKGQGEKILLHTYSDDDAEARQTAEQIEFARLARRVPWRDQAVLFRTNQQARPLETALRQANIRYHLIGGQSFFDRREIKDFLAFLKTFLNPHDDISLLRIANVPARGLSDVTMERLLAASHQRSCSVFSAMRHTDVQAGFVPKTRESLAAFVGFIQRHQAGLRDGAAVSPRQWADNFLQEIAYEAELRRGEKTPDAAENRIRNLKELVATLRPRPPIPPRNWKISWTISLWTPTARRKKNSPATPSRSLPCTVARVWSFPTFLLSAWRTACCHTPGQNSRAIWTRSAACSTSP